MNWKTMDETDLALKRLNDTGAFETLTAAYLEWQQPEIRGLIQTGINSEGKPIPYPVDGLRIIPVGDGSQRLVMLAASTTGDDELSRKWLGEQPTKKDGTARKNAPKNGDLQKAAKELTKWKKTHPKCRGTLYLATNRYPDLKLLQSALVLGPQLGLDAVEFVEASALLRYLKFNADGQYAGETILKVPAARLSKQLMTDICRESLAAHAARFPLTHKGTWTIARDVTAHLAELVARPGPKLIALQGMSGIGKSILLRQLGERVLQTGGFAMWAPADAVETGHAPEEVLLQILRHFRPGLGGRAGAEALELAAACPGGIVLLVDDVNRLPRPSRALETVGELAGISSTCRWLVPVWPGQVQDVPQTGAMRPTAPPWSTVDVGPYSQIERDMLGMRIPRALCDVVEGDPFLCALMPDDARFDFGPARSDVLRQVTDKIIERAIHDAAAERRLPGVTADFAAALDVLIACVLRLDDPEPLWSRLRFELGDMMADRVVVLAERSRLGYVEPGASGHWRWTHDRMRDLILGRWLCCEILSHERELTPAQDGLLRNPGLAEAWAIACAFLPPGPLRIQALQLCRTAQPVALAKLLQFRLFPTEGAERDLLCKALTETLTSIEARKRTVIGAAEDEALWALTQTDDHLVLQIVPEVTTSKRNLIARIRNGDVNAALNYVHIFFQKFLPVRHFESAVAAFGKVLDKKRDQLVEGLKGLGNNADGVRSLFILAGYLAWPEWGPLIRDLWQGLPPVEKDRSIAEAIWALARTTNTDAPPELEEAILRGCDVVEKELQARAAAAGPTLSVGRQPHEELGHVWSRWPVPRTAARVFARLLKEQASRVEILWHMSAGIDTPEMMEALVRNNPASFTTGDVQDPLSDRNPTDTFPRNPETRDRLWELSRTDGDPEVCKRAFRAWRQGMSTADLRRLQEVPTSEPLFSEVLAARVRLRDLSAAPLLIERMNSAPAEWCAYAPAVYAEPGVEEAFVTNLEAAFEANGFHAPGSVAIHLSPDQLRRLIERKGQVLQKYHRSWPALWQSDVPEALEFVRRAIEQASFSLDGFFFEGGWPFPVSMRMLQSLRPALGKFSQFDLAYALGLLAIQAGYAAWVREQIVPHLQIGSRMPWIDREMALLMLDSAAGAAARGDMAVMQSNIFELAQERGKWLFESAVAVVREWLGTAPRSDQVFVAGLLVEQIGSGADWDWWQALAIPAGTVALFERVGWHLRRRRWQPGTRGHG